MVGVPDRVDPADPKPSDREGGHAGNLSPSDKAYRDGCRCPECRSAHALAARRRRLAKGSGEGPLVDAKPVREAVMSLIDKGFSQAEIARSAGISQTWVNDLVRGVRSGGRVVRRVTSRTAKAVLQVTERSSAPGQLVDDSAFRSLVARAREAGLSDEYLMGLCGLTVRQLSWISKNGKVRSRTAAALMSHQTEIEDAIARFEGAVPATCGQSDEMEGKGQE